MSGTIDLYFWGTPFEDGEGDGPVRSLIHVNKRAQYAYSLVDWPDGADMVEVVVPGVGHVRLAAPSPVLGGRVAPREDTSDG